MHNAQQVLRSINEAVAASQRDLADLQERIAKPRELAGLELQLLAENSQLSEEISRVRTQLEVELHFSPRSLSLLLEEEAIFGGYGRRAFHPHNRII